MEIENNFAVSIVGGNHRNDRKDNDFYATTPECVTSFLHYERDHLKGMKIWEPCCGDGAISKLLINDGFEVFSTDLVDRGYGIADRDFLLEMDTTCNAIVTNPPFNLSEQIISHALAFLKVDYLALLLKSQYWHAKRRAALFAAHPPDFTGKGSSTMDCQWTVWRKHDGPTAYQPMTKIVF
jgi:hypothetical protein